MCASPASPLQAHPDWIGAGLVSRHMKQAPATMYNRLLTGLAKYILICALLRQWESGHVRHCPERDPEPHGSGQRPKSRSLPQFTVEVE
jgi:hypothetical protein